jgi:hypothetical protein
LTGLHRCRTVKVMLWVNISFIVALFICCIRAWWIGGWEGKTIAATMMIGCLATGFVVRPLSPIIGAELATFAIDLPVALIFGFVAIKTDRYWPLWIIAFHALSILTYVAWLLNPIPRDDFYRAISSFWSLLILLAMYFGPRADLNYDLRKAARNGTNHGGRGAHPY